MLSNTSCQLWEGNLTRTCEQKDRTSQLLCRQDRVKNARERWQRLTANVKVATVKSEGRQMKQCWIIYIIKIKKRVTLYCTYKSAYRGLTSSAPNEESSNSGCSQFFMLKKLHVRYSKWVMFIQWIVMPHIVSTANEGPWESYMNVWFPFIYSQNETVISKTRLSCSVSQFLHS